MKLLFFRRLLILFITIERVPRLFSTLSTVTPRPRSCSRRRPRSTGPWARRPTRVVFIPYCLDAHCVINVYIVTATYVPFPSRQIIPDKIGGLNQLLYFRTDKCHHFGSPGARMRSRCKSDGGHNRKRLMKTLSWVTAGMERVAGFNSISRTGYRTIIANDTTPRRWFNRHFSLRFDASGRPRRRGGLFAPDDVTWAPEEIEISRYRMTAIILMKLLLFMIHGDLTCFH